VRSEDEAETKFRAGDTVWHRTGDSGWLDDRNRLWLTGRCAARVGPPAGNRHPVAPLHAAADRGVNQRRRGIKHQVA
jgi:long-subunit acyl-CoA synthetase (AMP-forming)